MALLINENPASGFFPGTVLGIGLTPTEGMVSWGHVHANEIIQPPELRCGSSEDHITAHYLQYFHDFRVVRALAVSRNPALDCDRGQLVDCLCRVLLSGTGKPDRLIPILASAAENDPGSYYPGRLFSLFRYVSSRSVPVELPGRFCIYHLRGVLHVL